MRFLLLPALVLASTFVLLAEDPKPAPAAAPVAAPKPEVKQLPQADITALTRAQSDAKDKETQFNQADLVRYRAMEAAQKSVEAFQKVIADVQQRNGCTFQKDGTCTANVGPLPTAKK